MSILILLGFAVVGTGALVGGTLQVTGIGGSVAVHNKMGLIAPLSVNGNTASDNTAADNNAVGTNNGNTGVTTRNTAGVITRNGVTTVDAGTLSRGALACFVALLLGAIAAWFGGTAGTVEPTITAYMPSQRRNLH
jgi:hypothetical protein